ncbi:MAG: CopK family periplasmic copper-binding protein [Aromatoleum sp.]|jgi:hypothetical protein|uniref:CopK family periplasmic copper-binding protein n=1 Tax=Aromatoleum sp. TaxID=2307007 RepID=UPI002894AE53|nr:CopK family periplasmic copper-binding protein [Aromatoleum sp.]MDT3668895.1 CopK family periplasmic copper-binding protein [Aromatoleum sp.]
MKTTVLRAVIVSAAFGVAISGAFAGGVATPVGVSANVEKTYALKDGTTLYVFKDGRMAMEDSRGNSVSMRAGQPMETVDGETIVMKGNEVWRERSHALHRGG